LHHRIADLNSVVLGPVLDQLEVSVTVAMDVKNMNVGLHQLMQETLLSTVLNLLGMMLTSYIKEECALATMDSPTDVLRLAAIIRFRIAILYVTLPVLVPISLSTIKPTIA